MRPSGLTSGIKAGWLEYLHNLQFTSRIAFQPTTRWIVFGIIYFNREPLVPAPGSNSLALTKASDMQHSLDVLV